MRDHAIVVDDAPDPAPGPGQTLVRTVACGICGSDLHFLRHGQRLIDLGREGNARRNTGPVLDLGRDVIMGHEFVAEVLEHGPMGEFGGATGIRTGDHVVSMPVMITALAPEPQYRSIGYSNDLPGGYAERMLLFSPMMLRVPNGLAPRHAALTEPMAVGLHAVNRSRIVPGEAAVVHGCGPVGLAVIASLRLAGIETVVAADFSPSRRALAVTMGATEVVDPATEPAIDAWYRVDGRQNVVQFDAIGVPGVINAAMRDAPPQSRIVVVGVCMEGDTIQPIFGINKELDIQFVLAYTPEEFAASLGHIAEGRFDVAPLITGSVGIDGVAGAFEALRNPDSHAKVLVEP